LVQGCGLVARVTPVGPEPGVVRIAKTLAFGFGGASRENVMGTFEEYVDGAAVVGLRGLAAIVTGPPEGECHSALGLQFEP